MVLDRLRKAIGDKIEKVRKDRSESRAQERAISQIVSRKADAAGRKERVRLAAQVAVKKEQAIAQGQLDTFRQRRKSRGAGGGGLGFNVVTGAQPQGAQSSGFSVVGGQRTTGFSVVDPAAQPRSIAVPRRRRARARARTRTSPRRQKRRATVRQSKQFDVI